MTHPVDYWRQEHEYFLHLLRLLQAQLDVFHDGREPDYTLMLDIVSYMREYSDQYHHPREDVAFARLARYCPEVELVVARLQQEHRVIAHAGTQLSAHVTAVLQGAVVGREEIEAAAATYLVYYLNHLKTEDNAILPRAARHMTADDWDAVRSAIPLVPDPLFGEYPQERFRNLRRAIAERQGMTAATASPL